MSIPNIYLIGFMGAGKSVVGQRLATLMKKKFIDLDRKIEEREGRLISQIFQEKGELFFRDLEQLLIEETKDSQAIIALGGGAFTEKILGYGITIYLKASLEELMKRIKGTNRPLLHRAPDLYVQRTPLYEKALISIETQHKTIEEVAVEIYEKL